MQQQAMLQQAMLQQAVLLVLLGALPAMLPGTVQHGREGPASSPLKGRYDGPVPSPLNSFSSQRPVRGEEIGSFRSSSQANQNKIQ